MNPTQTPPWKKLESHQKEIASLQMKTLFQQDAERFTKFSLHMPELLIDYSKNRITEYTIKLLIEWAYEMKLTEKRDAMFAGDLINMTEHRAVLHTALRNPTQIKIEVGGKDIMPLIRQTLEKMRIFSKAVRDGEWKGYNGQVIKDIVNIGIGGSDLGPKMVCRALAAYSTPILNVHFISNIDGAEITETLKNLDPETTLFCIASKTFTTLETLTNAETAKKWLLKTLHDEKAVSRHFIAISANSEKTKAFGIDENNVFEFWDFVGGRYSVWSAIGLPIALYLGMGEFEQFLIGAYEMDEHFKDAELEKNAPVILGLIDTWYRNFFHTNSHTVIPYNHYLNYFYPYLQQLEMESNGKSMSFDQTPVNYKTCPVIWGGPGTDKQHAFHQLLHQGTDLIPIDFIIAAKAQHHLQNHQNHLFANCLAQSQALMLGRTQTEIEAELAKQNLPNNEIARLAPHKVMPGNRPSNTIILDQLTPKTLGALVALYEHRVFVNGIIWNINSFDQFGVELGKTLAKKITPDLNKKANLDDYDSSTRGLIEYYRRTAFKE